MKKLKRPSLAQRQTRYLRRKQQELLLDKARNVETIWKNARKTLIMRSVVDVLIQMVGPRARCMFCHDSRGTTIEHFYPKAIYRKKVFAWKNFFLLCQGCQTRKGNRLDLDPRGFPLLIDPTIDDPWDHLYFDGHTGQITAKFDANGVEDPKGRHTTDPEILPLNIEAITLGRQKTRRNLIRAVMMFRSRDASGEDLDAITDDLIKAILDNDDYGLVVHRSGF